MKALKFILILVGVLVVAWVIMNTLGPKEVNMSRTKSIDASKEVVWDHIRSLEAMDKWGPWMEMDPEAEGGIEGPEGEVGSKGWWKGEKVGEGTQTISEVNEYESMSVDMEFINGGNAMPADAKIAMADGEEGNIDVEWSFHMDLPWMWRGMSMFMGDGDAGDAYEKGLANLKEMCEAAPEVDEDETTYEIMNVEREAMRYVGMRGVVKMEDLGDHYQTNMPVIGQTVGPMASGAPSGLYWTWDEENKETDMAVAMVCAEGEAEGMEAFDVEAGPALMVEYYGDYAESMGAHMAINAHMEENGLEMRDVVIEEYVTDPGPDTSLWQTNIYYMVQEVSEEDGGE